MAYIVITYALHCMYKNIILTFAKQPLSSPARRINLAAL